MAFRFRRTISIFPGVRVNLGKRGVSVSAGVRGANVTLGRTGLYGNVGIPGSGVSYRKRLLNLNSADGKGRRADSATPSLTTPTTAEDITQIQLNTKTGDIAILDANGNYLGDEALEFAKTHARQHLEDTLRQQVDSHNQMMARINSIHLDTPAPDHFPKLLAEPFDALEPEPPVLRKLDWLAYFCPARRKAFANSNERKGQRYQNQHEQWTQEKSALDQRESARATLYQSARTGNVAAMESVLDDHMLDIDWPQQTELSFELSGNGKTLMLDVDLPEIEDFPTTELRVYERGIGVSVNELSATASRKLYMAHVHGMGVRLIGECFACAPSVEEVILSAFTQVVRTDTGQTNDTYIYSVKVGREAWGRIRFDNLDAVDPVAVLAAFELRRNMTKTGFFTAIEPW